MSATVVEREIDLHRKLHTPMTFFPAYQKAERQQKKISVPRETVGYPQRSTVKY
jgi:hypothetical protein